MSRYTIIQAPSALGLFPRGVEGLPRALLDAGIAVALGARRGARVMPPPYDPLRDHATGLLNPTGLRSYAYDLATVTGKVLDRGEVPIVLGGDCSILLGNLLALRGRGRHGLLFIDGHADFYQPQAEPNGEAASMDLALATGRGPDVVTDFDGLRPLVFDEDVVHFARRDAEEAAAAGSQRIEDTDIMVIDLSEVRRRGVHHAAEDALDRLLRPELAGFWIHLDCDAIDDALMPAVDYRLPGGLSWEELEAVLGDAMDSGAVVGLEVTIFNPALDGDGSIARRLVSCLRRGLADGGQVPQARRSSPPTVRQSERAAGLAAADGPPGDSSDSEDRDVDESPSDAPGARREGSPPLRADNDLHADRGSAKVCSGAALPLPQDPSSLGLDRSSPNRPLDVRRTTDEL